MNKSEKYSEIILLGQMLQERKIEHEQHDLSGFLRSTLSVTLRSEGRDTIHCREVEATTKAQPESS